jgi:autotransporter-associated beta strand protein
MKTPMKQSVINLFGALAFVALSTSSVQAVSDTWSGSVNSTWDISTLNWNSGASAFTSGHEALFTGTPANNVTAATGLTIGAITLDNTFTGSVALTGANTVGGATTISAGTLSLANSATAAGSSAITVNSPGKLALNASTTADMTYANTVAGAGKVQFLYVSSGGHDIFLHNLGSFTGTIQLSLASGSSSTGGKARLTTTDATLSGTSSLIIDGGTQLYMGTGNNATFANIQVSGTGNTENRGAIRFQSGMLTSPISLMGDTTFGTEGATLPSGSPISAGSSGLKTLTLGGASDKTSGNLTINSIISDGSGQVGLNQLNTGTLTLSGVNTYGGGTTISAGTLSVGNSSALGSGTVAFAGGSLSDSTAVTLPNNFSTATSAGTFSPSSGAMVLNGNITGGNSLTLNPTSKITLAGANSFGTTAAFGSLAVNGGAGGVDITGSTAVANGNSAGNAGYVNVSGTVTVTVQSGGSFAFGATTGATPSGFIGQNAAGTSTLLVNGGSLSIGGNLGLGLGNNIATAIGVLTITNNGMATISAGSTTLQDQRNFIAMGRDNATGIINLAPGTLACGRQFVRDGSSGGTAGSGTASFNFNGGKLQALANQTAGNGWFETATTGNFQVVTTTIMDGGATIDANGFGVNINTVLAHGGVAATDGGLTLTNSSGTGTLTLGGVSTYTGPTVVKAGTLKVTGTVPTATTVNPGGAIGASSGTFGALVTLAAGNSAVNQQDGSASTTTFANGLTLNNGNVLAFDLGSSSDQISVGGTFTHNGTTTINLAVLSGFSATTYTLITGASITATNGFVLGSVPAGFSGTLVSDGANLQVMITQNAPSVAFWKGDVDNKWNSVTGGNNSNWATDSSGATDTVVPPSTPSSVTFAATGAANFSTVLGANFVINDLTLSTANNVTIAGTTNSLTLVNGLLNDTTALNNTLSVSNVVLGGSQTWQNNSANPLTVSSLISGSSALTIGGTGTIVLTSTNNNYNGGTAISAGTLQLGDGTASNGAVSGTVTDNSVLVFANPAAQTFSGAIGGVGQLVKTGAGILTLSSSNSYSSGTIVSNGTLQLNVNAAAGSGAITVNSNLNLNISTVADASLANTVNGGGTINVLLAGNNKTVFAGDMSGFTGAIKVASSGGLGSKAAITSGAVNLSSAASITVSNGGTFYTEIANIAATINVSGTGNNEGLGALRVDNGANISGPVNLQGNATIGGFVGVGTISGVIDDNNQGYGIGSGNAGTINVTALNEVLAGANTYHGVTPWNRPTFTLNLANELALQNSTLNYTAGKLQFDSSVGANAFTFGGLTGSANITLTNTGGASITLSVGNNNSSTTYSGNLSDNALGSSLTKVGSGTLTLSGANSYSGTTTVAGGKLMLNTLQTNATTEIAVNDGATLAVNVSGTNQLAPASYTLGSSVGPVVNEFVSLNSTNFAPVNAGTLTLNGQTTINIIGGSFVVGKKYPLIAYTSIGGAGGFVIGALPRGLVANVITNGANNAIVLNVTASNPVSDVWTGSISTNWDIATTANWLTNGVATFYLDGDNTRFDDTATATNVFVTTPVIPNSVTVSNVSKTFTFTGSAIGGAGSLTKQGSGLLVLSQANTYSGNTVVSNGTLKVATANAIPNGAGKGDVVVGGTLDLNTNSITINGLSGNGTVDTVAGGTPTLTVGNNNASSTFSGTLQNSSGSLALTKTGNGTLVLSGTNAYTGATAVNQGSLNYTGSLGIAPATAAGLLTINNSGNNAIVNVSAPANLQFNNNNPLIGNNAAGAGALYQSGGTLSGVNQFQLGAVTGGSYGYYKLSGGTNTMAELDLGSFNGAAVGVLDMSGGTMNITSWFVPSRGNAAIGMLNMTGGTLNFSGPVGQFQGNWNGGVGTAVINLANASLLAPSANVSLMQTGVAGKLGEINLLTGGLLQANSIAPNSATGSSVLNFNGGTLKANTANATFITANNTAVNVYGNGGTIDNNGANITIPVPLLAPADDGINDPVTVDNGGSGYIGAPAVTFSGGGGVGAAGYAVMSGGSVASIVMTSPGYGYSSAPTVVLTGGGGSGASATAPAPTPNTSGGMTFTGAGTNILTAANTYTGNTTVSSGTLLVNGSTSTGAVTVNGGTLGGTGTIGGAVTVNSGGTLAPGAGIGTLTISGNLTLNAGSTNAFEVDGTGPANDMVAAGASVTYGGVLNIVPTGTFSSGQTFTLFSGGGAASASNFSSIAGSPGSGLGFTFTNGVLSVVTTGPSGPATITNSVSGGVLSLSWPAGQGWRLQMQTNSLATGLGTNWTYITDGSLSSTNITIDPSKPTVFYRLANP